MLEAHAHHQLKDLLHRESSIWPHNLTLSRLVGRSLRRRDKTLIQLAMGSEEFWWPGLLIPLFLESSDVVLLLSEKQRRRLINFELLRLKNAGFKLPIWEGKEAPPHGKLWLLNYSQIIPAFKNGLLDSKQLIIPQADILSERLRDVMSIKIDKLDWEKIRRSHPAFDYALLDIYQKITKNLFINATCQDDQIAIDNGEITPLKDLLALIGVLPSPWDEVISAINKGWSNWAQLDHKTLDWSWHFQPLEPLQDIQRLLIQSPFVMFTGSWRNDLLLSELQSINCSLDISIRLKGMIQQEPIQLFVPLRQPLPNTEYFTDHILDQSRRLILGLQGITIVLLDDLQLRKKLTSELASEFGRRVVHETTAPEHNGVVCCSCSWWLKHHDQMPAPQQLIFAILPFASLESPLLAARVNAFKKQGKDWFRDLLLPDVLRLMPYAVQPIRSNQGRIAILDGRVRSRSWGDLIFRTLEPWTALDRLLPH